MPVRPLRPSLQRPIARVALVAAMAGLFTGVGSGAGAGNGVVRQAVAQEDGVSNREARSREDRDRIEDQVRALTNNRVVGRNDTQVARRIAVLLNSRDPDARRALREILANTSAPQKVIEHLGVAILFDSGAADLVPDVIERLRVERASALAHYFDGPLVRYADAALVRSLAALAKDASRTVGYRLTAVRALGITAHTNGLPVLLELWSDPAPDVRLAASRAFIHVVPFIRSRADAATLLDHMRESGLPLVEVLRERLRAVESVGVEPVESDYLREYIDVSMVALPHLPLDQVVALFLDSPVAELRLAAAERMATVDYDSEPDPALARIGVGTALFDTLRREEDADVERAILSALVPLARPIRGHVDRAGIDALMRRARASGRAARDVRIAAIQLLGALRVRDPRPVAMLQSEFDGLADTDPDLRIEILKSLSAIAVDQTGWLSKRVLSESYDRVAEAMVVELAKMNDPGAISAFNELLARPHPSDIVRHNASSGLVSLWATHGVAAARDILIARGLNDASVTVRETSASGLGNRPSDDPRLLAALEGVVMRPDENVRVRKAAAGSLLDLDPDGALHRLISVLADGTIWDVVRQRRVDRLVDGEIDVKDVLSDTDALWGADEQDVRDRALQLLQAVVDAGTGLWEGSEGRGLVHERLARLLLDSARPEDACDVAALLVSDGLRADDPAFRWRLLFASSLRACGTEEPLHRAAAQLSAMRTDKDLPPAIRSAVLLELGETLLQLDDPTGAVEILGMIGDAVDLTLSEKKRRAELTTLADERSVSERQLVLELLARLDEPEARSAFKTLGYRAARHLHAALLNESDLAALRRIMNGAGVLTGTEFTIPEPATDDETQAVRNAALAALLRLVATGPESGGR